MQASTSAFLIGKAQSERIIFASVVRPCALQIRTQVIHSQNSSVFHYPDQEGLDLVKHQTLQIETHTPLALSPRPPTSRTFHASTIGSCSRSNLRSLLEITKGKGRLHLNSNNFNLRWLEVEASTPTNLCLSPIYLLLSRVCLLSTMACLSLFSPRVINSIHRWEEAVRG